MADRDPWEAPAAGAAPERDPWEAPRAAPAAAPWDIGTEAMNAAMLGYGPQINGLLGGNAAADRAAHQAFDAAHPYQALGANLVGGAVPAAAMTMAGVPPMAAGAIQGGANGYAETGNPLNAAIGATVGGLGAGAAQGVGALARYLGILPGVAPTVAAAPTRQALDEIGGNQFNALRASGATFPHADVNNVATQAAADLQERGLTPGTYGTAPKANAVLADLAKVSEPQGPPIEISLSENPGAHYGPFPARTPEKPASIVDLDAIRKAAGNVRGPSVDPSDQYGAGLVGNRILDLYSTNPEIAALSAEARGNTGAAFRSEDIQNILANAQNRAAATGSGMNLGNSTRQRVASFIDPSQNRAENFTPSEMAMLQRVVDGSRLQNAARKAGNILGGGGGLGSAGAGIGGAALLGPLGASLPFVGTGLKHLDNYMAARALRAVDEATRMRSPLGQQIQANFVPPAPPVAPGAVPATIGGLLGAYVGGSGQ